MNTLCPVAFAATVILTVFGVIAWLARRDVRPLTVPELSKLPPELVRDMLTHYGAGTPISRMLVRMYKERLAETDARLEQERAFENTPAPITDTQRLEWLAKGRFTFTRADGSVVLAPQGCAQFRELIDKEIRK